MRKLASEGKARVFATDAILTTLMCVKSSKYSWDLIVTKKGAFWPFCWGLGAVLVCICLLWVLAVVGMIAWGMDSSRHVGQGAHGGQITTFIIR